MHNYASKLVDSSRIIADILVADIGTNEDKFKDMMEVALQDKYPVSMRAARVIDLCVSNNENLIIPFLPVIVQKINNLRVDGVKRSFCKLIINHVNRLDEDSLGWITDCAFTCARDNKEAIAIRYYCIEILFRVTQLYPGLKQELTEVLKEVDETGSPGIKSACRSILIALQKKDTNSIKKRK